MAGDVDPRVGEHLLDVLAAGGIAAYLQPAADLHPITRTTTMPSRPTDRLYVDRAHLATAREYLAQLGGGGAESPEAARAEEPAPPSETDVDAAWARIVADLQADLDPETSTWPDTADKPTRTQEPPIRRRSAEERHTDERRTGERPADEPSLLDGLDTFGADLPDDEGTYTPPPPPPLPRLSKVTVAAVIAILAGFTLFIWPTLIPIGESLARFVGFVSCFGGVAALIWRLRPGDDDSTDPDDGAVV